jgi:hypothetical protein
MYTHLPMRKMCVRKKIRKILNPREIHDFIETFALYNYMYTRYVQIRSESDPIGLVRISEQKYTFRIGSD